MIVASVSNQNFEGRVIGCSWLKPKHRRIFKQVKPCLENMVKKKNYDLKISLVYGKLRISAGKKPEYAEIESNTASSWINGAKEIIRNYEKE